MNSKNICILIILIFASALSAEAQSFFLYKRNYNQIQQHHGELSFYGGAGLSTYLGDLKSARFKLDAKPNLVFGLQMRYNTYVSFRGEFTWYRIAGMDANQPIESGLPSRNLSFRADNFEAHLAGVVHAFPRYRIRNKQPSIINPYLFLGLGTTTNNPTAEYLGSRYNLRKLETQGKPYSGMAVVVPFGLGVDFRINNKFDIGIETGYRITFTDQLDDASNPTYIPSDFFLDPIAAALSDRRGEVGIIPGAPSGAGGVRGNPTSNDSFLLVSIRGHYYIFNSSSRIIRYRKPRKTYF